MLWACLLPADQYPSMSSATITVRGGRNCAAHKRRLWGSASQPAGTHRPAAVLVPPPVAPHPPRAWGRAAQAWSHLHNTVGTWATPAPTALERQPGTTSAPLWPTLCLKPGGDEAGFVLLSNPPHVLARACKAPRKTLQVGPAVHGCKRPAHALPQYAGATILQSCAHRLTYTYLR